MKLSLVEPVFNEEAMLALFYRTVRESEALAPYDVEIVLVNDVCPQPIKLGRFMRGMPKMPRPINSMGLSCWQQVWRLKWGGYLTNWFCIGYRMIALLKQCLTSVSWSKRGCGVTTKYQKG